MVRESAREGVLERRKFAENKPPKRPEGPVQGEMIRAQLKEIISEAPWRGLPRWYIFSLISSRIV